MSRSTVSAKQHTTLFLSEQESYTSAFPPPMKITNDGYRAWFTAHNDLGIERYMAALGYGDYIVMIDPASLSTWFLLAPGRSMSRLLA